MSKTVVETRRLSDIETDGVCINHVRDPPGQRSVYIPPGDPEKESYRLSTFKDFPRNVPINPCQFAVNGFYYTGYKDRVKCFGCGQSCENWLAGDDISLTVWHKRDCEFKNGTDTTNIPIGMLFQHRNPPSNTSQVSNQHLPRHATLNRPNQLAATRTNQQTSSGSNAMTHQTTTATNQTNHAQTSGNHLASNTVTNTLVSNILTITQERNNFSEIFPCLNPINPHMRRTEARLQTFIDNSRLWPSYRLRATPEEIADAGMYFLGERDRVKCWYCNGGLQNWERDDDPWVEHAKWFPMCEYLLQRKGPDFVHRIVAQYPDLRRPTLRNPAPASSANEVIRVVQSGPSYISGSLNQANQAPVIVDPREKLRKQNRKIEQFMTSSELVAEARSLGFEDDVIRAALKRKLEANDEEFADLSSLVDAILDIPEGEPANENIDEEEPSSSSGIRRSTSVSNMTPSEGMEEMRRLEESRNCKSCHRNQACMVFIPCGHLACCAECGKDIEKCPICKSRIQERIKSYVV